MVDTSSDISRLYHNGAYVSVEEILYEGSVQLSVIRGVDAVYFLLPLFT